jgi:hypothetical protein
VIGDPKVRSIINELADTIRQAAGPGYTGKLLFVINVHQGRAKVFEAEEKLLVERRS